MCASNTLMGNGFHTSPLISSLADMVESEGDTTSKVFVMKFNRHQAMFDLERCRFQVRSLKGWLCSSRNSVARARTRLHG